MHKVTIILQNATAVTYITDDVADTERFIIKAITRYYRWRWLTWPFRSGALVVRDVSRSSVCVVPIEKVLSIKIDPVRPISEEGE